MHPVRGLSTSGSACIKAMAFFFLFFLCGVRGATPSGGLANDEASLAEKQQHLDAIAASAEAAAAAHKRGELAAETYAAIVEARARFEHRVSTTDLDVGTFCRALL